MHTNEEAKPIASPQRSVPYYLQESVENEISEMIKNDVIEEHPPNEPASWISNTVVTPKPNGTLRITLDARNVNKAMKSTNLPIQR